MRRRALMAGVFAASGAPDPRAQEAAPVLFVAGAAKAAVEAIFARWSDGSAMPRATFDTVGALRDRILSGERPAVALLSAEAIAALAARGLVAAGSETVIGRTGVGLAAPSGRSVPDIGSPEALRAALLAAPSIAWADPARGATAGRHFAAVLERLGIAEAVRAKARLVPFGVEGVAMAARGEVALAVSQATEIVGRPGVAFVGFLPDALQLWTEYRAAVVADGPGARRALAALTTPAAREAFAATGFR